MRRTFVIILFMAVISSPLAGWLSGLRTVTTEKRALSPMPDLSLRNVFSGGLYKGFEKFHDDRFPFRGWLIKGANWIDYRLFRASPSPNVHIGKEGWLFYVPSLEDFLKEDCGDRGNMWRLAKKLHDFERMVEESGRRFLFIIAPNKSTIYPEYVGLRREPTGCGKSRLELLLEAFGEYPVKNYILLEESLVEARTEADDASRLFYKTDTHWNIHGAKIASRAILRKLAPFSWADHMPEVKVKAERKNGDLADMIEMFGDDIGWLDDYALEISHSSTVTTDELPHPGDGKPMLRISASSPSGRPLLPRTLIYRDSFMKLPIEIIKGSFERLDAVWSSNVPSLEGYEHEEIKMSEIIIIEVVERDLPNLKILF